MTDANFFTGTRSQPLGDRKTGLSAELDALAAYVGSLATFDISPFRPGSNKLTADATAGRDVFAAQRCGICHAGTKFSGSGDATLSDIGSIKPSSGSRLYGALTDRRPDSARWATAPICTTAPRRH
jgi:cytochrome c peroxidase